MTRLHTNDDYREATWLIYKVVSKRKNICTPTSSFFMKNVSNFHSIGFDQFDVFKM
jgi:hypothetical protein